MARVRVRLGDGEVEIESRDFRVDNENAAGIVAALARYARGATTEASPPVAAPPRAEAVLLASAPPSHCSPLPPAEAAGAPAPPADKAPDVSSVLDCLDDAEAPEPEFEEEDAAPPPDVRGRLRALGSGSFFDSPRTALDAAERLRERGWGASAMDVSRALSEMALGRELVRDSRGCRIYYSAGPRPVPEIRAGPRPVPEIRA